MKNAAAAQQRHGDDRQRQRDGQRQRDRPAAAVIGRSQNQHEAERRKGVLDGNGNEHFHDDRSAHATGVVHTPAREADADDLPTYRHDGQQAAHRLAHGRDPPEEGERRALKQQQMPGIGVEQQRQRVKRHEPKQRKAGLADDVYDVARAIVHDERDQNRNADGPAGPLQPFRHRGPASRETSSRTSLCRATRVPAKSAKPPVGMPAMAAATRGESSAANSSAWR